MAQVKTLDDIDFRPRLIMGVEGEAGTGKTAFGLSAVMSRPPLTVMRFDYASRGALRALKNAGMTDNIFIRDYDVDPAKDLAELAFAAKEVVRKSKDKSPRELQAAQQEADAQLAAVRSSGQIVYEDFKLDYAEALSLGGSVLIDTGAELYEAARMAIFGLLRQVPQMAYERTNKEMMHLISMAEESDSNLIIVNKMKDDWVDSKEPGGKRYKSGKMVTRGWEGIDYPAHVLLRLYREGTKSDPTRTGPPKEVPGKFCMQFTKCNDGERDDLTGTCHEIPEPLLGFDQVGELIFGKEWTA